MYFDIAYFDIEIISQKRLTGKDRGSQPVESPLVVKLFCQLNCLHLEITTLDILMILYMLIGPKGAGKTHIGTLVGQHTDITFLRVESIWLGLHKGENGWEKVEAAIDRSFQSHGKVMIESLGAGEDFARFHASLAKKYTIRLIRVRASPDTCLTRVKNRNSAEHISVSDEKVMEYNKIAESVAYDWDLEINNDEPAVDADILAAIQSINT